MIGISCDHSGVRLKRAIMAHLEAKGIMLKDFGTDENTPSDYPDNAHDVASAVSTGYCEKGIIICGTGIGISITANKLPGIRAALCTDSYMAKMSREHNDANVLALGARVIGTGVAIDIVDAWLSTPFSNDERHKARINKICSIEKKYTK